MIIKVKGTVTLLMDKDEVKVDKIKLEATGTLLTSVTQGSGDHKKTYKTVKTGS